MPGPTAKSKTERHERMALIAKLDKQGWHQHAIAREVGVSQPMVCILLKKIRKQYNESQYADRAEKVAEKLTQYRDLRMEAWEAWQRSKGDAYEVVEEFADNCQVIGEAETDGQQIKRIVSRSGRLPNNSYLQTILQTLQAERDMLGLDETANDRGVALEEAVAILQSILQAQREELANYPDLLSRVQQRTLSLMRSNGAALN